MRVCTVNVNSLINKINSVHNLILDNNISVLGVCETWLVSSMSSSFVDLPGFCFFRGDVVGSIRKHGVGIYVDSRYKVRQIDVSIANLVIVYFVDFDVYFVVCYRPPSYTVVENDCLKSFLLDFMSGKSVVLMGDFNLPTLQWHEK